MRECDTELDGNPSTLRIRSWCVILVLLGYSLFVLFSFCFGANESLKSTQLNAHIESLDESKALHRSVIETECWNQIEIQNLANQELASFETGDSESDFYVVITSNGNPLDVHEISMECVPTEKNRLSRHNVIDVISTVKETVPVKPWVTLVNFRKTSSDRIQKSLPNHFEIPVFYDTNSPPETTTTVKSQVVAQGNWVTVYLDNAELDSYSPNRLAREIVLELESNVGAKVVDLLGLKSQSRNQPLSILLTTQFIPHQTFRAQNEKVPLRGFVKSFDSANGEINDLICMDSRLGTNAELSTLLTHEFTHVVTARADRLNRRIREDWMSEALAHLSEIRCGCGLENLNPRIKAFLANPHSKPLQIDNFRESGFYRDPVSRGAGALFLDFCVTHFGVKMLKNLVHSDQSSIETLEQVSQISFPQLLQNWGLELADSRMENRSKQSVQFIEFNKDLLNEQMYGTSNLFIRCSNIKPGTAIRILATEGSEIQVAVKRLNTQF